MYEQEIAVTNNQSIPFFTEPGKRSLDLLHSQTHTHTHTLLCHCLSALRQSLLYRLRSVATAILLYVSRLMLH